MASTRSHWLTIRLHVVGRRSATPAAGARGALVKRLVQPCTTSVGRRAGWTSLQSVTAAVYSVY